MTKEELQSVLKIPPRCIYVGKDEGWEVSDFLVDCSGYIGSINLDSLERLRCSIAFNQCKFIGEIVEKNKTYQYAFIFRRCSFQGFRFFDCAFKERINFDSCIFAQGVVFSDSRLNKKICFSNCRFEYEAMFVRTKFMEASSFVRSIFENNAIFYGAQFNRLVSFNHAIFKSEVSFVNVAMDFDFGNLKNMVIEMATKEDINEKIMTNDYRDSFRLIKNSLAKNGNTLDASQYHKMELYCKEIELESKEQKSLSDWLEKWQLWFYRKTSDHHTDLLRIVGWVMACIGLFGLVSFGYHHGGQLIDSSEIDRYPVMHFLEGLWGAEVYRASSESGFVLLAIGVSAVGLLSNFSRMILGVLLSLCVVISNPKNIFGVAKLFEGQKISGAENVIIFFYAFVMILLLFSLQKTARKNTITPN